MRFWKFQIFEKCPGPIFQKPAKNGVLKMPPFVRFYFFQKPAKNVFEKIQIFEQLPGSKIPLLAIHKIISHIWEDAPRKVNNDEPDLRFFHGNFWPVIDQAVRKPCPRGVYRFHPFPEKWLASGFLDSRWVPGFTIGSWIHDGSSILRKAEDLMPRDIMSS